MLYPRHKLSTYTALYTRYAVPGSVQHLVYIGSSFDEVLDLTHTRCYNFMFMSMLVLLCATNANTYTAPASVPAAKTKGRTGSIITKLPHPEKHPVNSCRGGSRNAGRTHTHASEEATVSSSAGGPTRTICA